VEVASLVAGHGRHRVDKSHCADNSLSLREPLAEAVEIDFVNSSTKASTVVCLYWSISATKPRVSKHAFEGRQAGGFVNARGLRLGLEYRGANDDL
jgi:hypothetical protein